MKVSVVITVFNEEKNISALIGGLLKQTKKPDEIVIVDGGSKDRTTEIIRHYQKKDKRIKLLIEPGSIAHGRNVSIDLARYLIIAQTDAGCTVKKDWLERITEPLKLEEVDLVAGFYNMVGDTSLQKAAAPFLGMPPKRFNVASFLPSARSMAFRKKVWEKVGGYSEKLERAGEDTLFVYQVIKHGFNIARVKNARVEWVVPKTFKELINKFYFYAKGDGQAGIWWDPAKRLASHNIRISAIFARYLIGLILVVFSFKFPGLLYLLIIFSVLYLFWSIWKMRDLIKDWKTRTWLPVIQISSDFAVMAGFAVGVLKKRFDIPQTYQ